MIFQPRRKNLTISFHRRANFSSLVIIIIIIIEMVVTRLGARGTYHSSIRQLHRPLIATAAAWIPQQQQQRLGHGDHHYRTRRLILRGSGGNDGCNFKYQNINPTQRGTSKHWFTIGSTRSSTTTSTQDEEKKEPDDAATEAKNMALSICGDEISARAYSTFGGLKYYNTDVDKRFRVLFVLGGPGMSYR